jgi:multiple sugar transport system ATP-binding protein
LGIIAGIWDLTGFPALTHFTNGKVRIRGGKMAGVVFEGVSKRYGDDKTGVLAVKDLNLNVADKEFLVLVGPSGSGKSTVLRMLAGLEDITAGKIWIGDRIVNDVASKDRNMAMVFQSYALYPHMSVRDNMAFSLKLARVPVKDIDRRVREAARVLSIEPLLQRKPSQLSGGQRQRVAVGRTIVREPDVFLFDEPLSNLDAKLRVETRAQLGELHARLGTTFIYVTHDQVEAMTLATRIAVLKEGVLQQVDTPETLYDRPTNVFVAGFIGSPSMNFFDVLVTGTPEALSVEADRFRVSVPADMKDRKALGKYLGRRVTMGIRPEDVYDRQYPPSDVSGEPISATVRYAELTGPERILYLQTNDKSEPFIARVQRRSRVRTGMSIDLVFDMHHAHFFDATNGQAISTS